MEDNLVVQNKQRFQLSAKEASKEDANAKKQKNAKPVQANLKQKADTDKQTDEPKSKVPKKIPGQSVLPKTKGKEIAKESGQYKGDNKKGAAPVDVNNNSIKGKPINAKNNGALKPQPKTGKVEPQVDTTSA